MKRCKRCGNTYSDEKVTCLECGERLPAPMSEAEILAEKEAARIKYEAQQKQIAQYHVGKIEKLVGILSFFFTAVSVAMMVLFFINSNNEPGMLCLAIALSFMIAAVTFLFPVKIWEINSRRANEKEGEKVYPSAGYSTVNKIVAYALFAGSLMILVSQITRLLYTALE